MKYATVVCACLAGACHPGDSTTPPLQRELQPSSVTFQIDSVQTHNRSVSVDPTGGGFAIRGSIERTNSCQTLFATAVQNDKDVRIPLIFPPRGSVCIPVSQWFMFAIAFNIESGNYIVTVVDQRTNATATISAVAVK